MRRPDPLISIYPYASVIAMLGIKLFSALLVIIIGGISFLNGQKTSLANPSPQAQKPALQQITLPVAPPDTEWGIALSTLVFSESLTLTPAADPTLIQTAEPTPFIQNTLPVVDAPAEPPLISSPLVGISLAELPGTVSQDFLAPPTGEDTGHHGVDFAFWSRGDQSSILGLPITAVFSGKVISAFNEIRLPYGYLIVTETPLSSLPQSVLSAIKLPELSAPAGKSDKLNCPTGFTDQWNSESQSLYVLYGHMNNPPAIPVGQMVNAGDIIGDVGNTGASSAPHLHLEMRIGPSNASFESIGHYDSATTDQERHNYCNWRISGIFQMFDPMTVLSVQ
ncbi:MAG: M23 family metallopeptidase [Anaerolineaceae bacterium]